MKVWLNGQVLEASEARISPLDRGFLLGDGLFETLACHQGAPFLWEEHLDRLEASAKALDIGFPGRAMLRDAVMWVVAANGLAHADAARVRITLTRGEGGEGGGVWPDEVLAPTVLVTASPVHLPAGLAEDGAAAITSAVRAVAGAPTHKSTSFQPNVLAKGEARRAGAWEALLRNERGEVAEGATSNVFAVRAGELHTPPPEAGILPGVTRAFVLRMARDLGITAEESALRPQALAGAGEAFLTSSLAGIVPLVRLDGEPIGSGAPGPVTRRLQRAYLQKSRGVSETGIRREATM